MKLIWYMWAVFFGTLTVVDLFLHPGKSGESLTLAFLCLLLARGK